MDTRTLITGILLLIFCLNTVSADVEPVVDWNKTFGGAESERAYSVQQTFDGGYIVAGFTKSFGRYGYDLWLIKTDNNGEHVWNKTFSRSGEDKAHSVQQTFDKDRNPTVYIVAGSTYSFNPIETMNFYDLWRQSNNIISTTSLH